ncbi:SurA N-terminal domain-containing protein [Halobacillus massiliensis]|uniref:SurA N-terminal domain-containing protein n=1 Tax=Halobacillus massiliensis TaxID=1926286 RepID=UPI0009E276B4|nr:SurA N-terminal domain-containing protein [Halobacillus massiliensis]
MKKLALTTLTFVLAALLLAACSNNEQADVNKDTNNKDKNKTGPVAIVNGKEISREEFESQVNGTKKQYEEMGMNLDGQEDTMKESIAEQMIRLELLKQEAEKKGYEVSEDELNKRYEEFISQFESDDAKDKAFKDSNLDEEKVKEELNKSLLINKYVDENTEEVKLTEKELKKEYETMKDQRGDGQKMPGYEKIKDDIKRQVINRKENDQLLDLVDQLKKDADIKRNI